MDTASVGRSRGSQRVRFGMTWRTTITMLLVGLFPLALFGGFSLQQEAQRIRADAEQSMRENGARIAGQVDEWVDKNVRVLRAAASLPTIRAMQPEDQAKVLAAVGQAYPWMYLVFTLAPDGRNVARSDGKPLTDYSDRQYYRDVVEDGKELSWETLIGKTSKKPALVVAVPIRLADGRVAGVLAAAMTIEDISRTVANWRAGGTGFAFLVDEKAKVVAHPHEDFVISQAIMNDHPLISSFRADAQPHLVSFVQTGGREALGYAQRNRFRWVVAVQQDTEELFAPLRHHVLIGLALLAIAAALVVVIAAISSRMLIRPIVEMTYAADRMSMGDLEESITVSRDDELGLLARSLERLRRSMKGAMARL